MDKSVIYAIDFGTSNTVITCWNSITKEAKVINLREFSQQVAQNPPLIPSLLYLQDGKNNVSFIGQDVRDRGLDIKNDPRFFSSFKRGIGTNIQGFLPQIDEETITFEKVGELFLNQVLHQLQLEVDAAPHSLVLTVPVDSFENYRTWLNKVCQNWSVDEIRLLDEPTAAALGYGVENEGLLLVIDFGGGTIDLSLVKLNNSVNNSAPQGFILKWGEKLLGEKDSQQIKTAKVLGKVGKNLGGADLDYWLVDYFVDSFNLPKSALINRLAERLKIDLSFAQKAEEFYFNDETLETYELKLTRLQFEEILRDHQFFEQLDELMTQILQQARRNGIEKEDINKVLLVGGSVQIPAIQEWVKTYFPDNKVCCDKPFSAIALGALQLAQGLEIKDFLYHSYGIRYWDRRAKRHNWHSLIKKGQPYPMSQPVELYLGASVENQPSIELVIGELGEENLSTEVYFDGDRLVTKAVRGGEILVQPLNDHAKTLATLDPLGQPGSDRIKLQFLVDDQRFLRVTVEDLFTNETLINNQILSQLS
jgi:molecular chaperone DnaK (HSP70)